MKDYPIYFFTQHRNNQISYKERRGESTGIFHQDLALMKLLQLWWWGIGSKESRWRREACCRSSEVVDGVEAWISSGANLDLPSLSPLLLLLSLFCVFLLFFFFFFHPASPSQWRWGNVVWRKKQGHATCVTLTLSTAALLFFFFFLQLVQFFCALSHRICKKATVCNIVLFNTS